MSDRLPGTTYDNPIWYRNYRIYLDDCAGTHATGYGFVHDDYDPTPMFADDGPSDHRHGFARTVQEARDEIDELECDTAQCEQCDPVKRGDATFCRTCGYTAQP